MTRFAAGSEFMDAYNAVASGGMDYNELGAVSQLSRSRQRSNAMVQKARMKYAEDQADVIKAGGNKQAGLYNEAGNQGFMGGIMSGVLGAGKAIAGGNFGGGFDYAGGPGSSGTPLGAGDGVVDGIGTLGPNYGIPQY